MGGFYLIHGMIPEIFDLRATVYRDEDVWTQAGIQKGLFVEGSVILGTELVPQDQLIETKWYKGFLSRDPGLIQMITSVIFGLDSTTSMPACVSFFRGPDVPMFGESDRQRLQLVLPHFSRSLGVMQRIRSAELTIASSSAALDMLLSGVLLTDSNGEITFANKAAQAILKSGDGLSLKKFKTSAGLGRLVAENELANLALGAALRATLTRDPFETEHFSDCVRVPKKGEASAYTLQFSALADHTEFGQGNAASAIIFLSDGAENVDVDEKALESAYSLSPAEARVAIALLECSSAKEVAAYLDVSPHTVRTQIKAIYEKMGVDTRPRFVKAMFGLARRRH